MLNDATGLKKIYESLPYVIDGKEYYTVEVIENEQIVPYNAIASGYVVNGRPKVPCQLSGRFRGRSIFSPFF